MLVFDQLAHQRDHDNGGGEVVEYRRHKEREPGKDPEKNHDFVGFNAIGDYRKAVVGVNYLDDGHGSEQEEQNGCYLTEVLQQMVLSLVNVGSA